MNSKLEVENDLYSNEEPVYFCFSATLRVFGNSLDLEDISKTLNLLPTSIHRRGERKGPHSTAYNDDLWAYQAPVPEDWPLDIHIQTLWSHLKEHKAYLLDLKRNFTVDVFCGYRSNSGIAGFQVSAQSLEIFVELDIPFGVSVIITDG